MKILLLTTLITLSFSAFSQSFTDVFKQELLKCANELRDSLHLTTLELDEKLHPAAEDQNNYIQNVGKLTHFQATFGKETPAERVLYYKTNRTYVGENVASYSYDKKVSIAADSLAKLFFKLWKNSPPHYKNMISPNFTQLGVALGHNEKNYFATQVFSSNENQLPREFDNPDISWGIRKAERNCKDEEQTYETMFFANRVVVEGNEIFMDFHDLKFFKRVINAPNDGFAIDIVFREQFPCDDINQLHLSEVHDGEMQRPVYSFDLFRNDISHNKNKIKTKIGEVPDYLSNQQWAANIIVINDNFLCDYTVPTKVSSGIYPLLEIEAFIDRSIDSNSSSPITLQIKDTVEIPIYFNRSDSISYLGRYEQEQMFRRNIGMYDTVWVDIYASVEGKTWFNEGLLEARKKSIQGAIIKYFEGDIPNIKYNLSENWDEMYRQINTLDLKELKGLSKEEIKTYLKRNPSEFYDSLLFIQRTAHLHARTHRKLAINTLSDYNFGRYFDTTLNVLDLPWQTLLPEKIENREELSSHVFDELYTEKQLKTNLLNIGSMNYAAKWYDSLTVQNFVEQIDTNDTQQLFNYVNFLTKYWYAKHAFSNSLRRVAITPEPEEIMGYMEILAQRELDTTIINRLELNVLLSGIHYYTSRNNWKMEKKYFKEIVKRAKKANLNAQEALELALFCNYFHEYEITIEILDDYYKRGLLTEDGLFVLTETAYLKRNSVQNVDYRAYFMAAKKVNRSRYCKWLDDYFQIQRDEVLKRDFCESCK